MQAERQLGVARNLLAVNNHIGIQTEQRRREPGCNRTTRMHVGPRSGQWRGMGRGAAGSAATSLGTENSATAILAVIVDSSRFGFGFPFQTCGDLCTQKKSNSGKKSAPTSQDKSARRTPPRQSWSTMIDFNSRDVHNWPMDSKAILSSNMDLTFWRAAKNTIKGEWSKIRDLLIMHFSRRCPDLPSHAIRHRVGLAGTAFEG
ncbi:hypothetical protein B0H19DRAFT_1060683 [Mycena capillaripes]|nr:hypothetical protein B0H19DRAFT_1060683 [Mycena capillaripes]